MIQIGAIFTLDGRSRLNLDQRNMVLITMSELFEMSLYFFLCAPKSSWSSCTVSLQTSFSHVFPITIHPEAHGSTMPVGTGF